MARDDVPGCLKQLGVEAVRDLERVRVGAVWAAMATEYRVTVFDQFSDLIMLMLQHAGGFKDCSVHKLGSLTAQNLQRSDGITNSLWVAMARLGLCSTALLRRLTAEQLTCGWQITSQEVSSALVPALRAQGVQLADD